VRGPRDRLFSTSEDGSTAGFRNNCFNYCSTEGCFGIQGVNSTFEFSYFYMCDRNIPSEINFEKHGVE